MIENLKPQTLWKHFAELNAIPRASKKEQQVIAFLKNFGEQLQLDTQVDEIGNIIIKKPASIGKENLPVVCLQSHIDMVHQKNADTQFDFDKQGIDMYVDGDWVKARGTTLGADNGIGVAAIMSILATNDIQHPAIEALFTVDEETGMTGAMGLKGGLLAAKYLLNLDTEEDTELTIGCAGGIDVSGACTYSEEPVEPDAVFYTITLKGLCGGHSGMDIHRGRGNANKLMNRLLWNLKQLFPFQLIRIQGGGLRNAIPREAQSTIAIHKQFQEKLSQEIDLHFNLFKQEYAFTDPDLQLELVPCTASETAMPAAFLTKLLNAIYVIPNGIFRMDSYNNTLVQSSNNLSRISVQEGKCDIQCLTRSSVDSEKMDLAHMIQAAFETLGAQCSFGGAYPGWTPLPDSDLVKHMITIYKAQQQAQSPHVNACHAGLECGILGKNYPHMQMVSFGPTIQGAHSPDERVSILSVQKFWSYLLRVLETIS